MFWRAFVILVLGYAGHYLWQRQNVITAEGLLQHRVRKISYWKDWQDEKLSHRVRMAPDGVIDYLHKDNMKNRWPNRPTAVGLDPELRRDIEAAIESIPAALRLMISRHTVGIFVVNDLGGTAYSESVFDDQLERTVGGFVVLDTSVLNRRANEWATWKEASPFAKSGNFRLAARIEETENDDRVGAFRYILMHEFAHVLSFGKPFDPSWKMSEQERQNDLAESFYKISWQWRNGENLALPTDILSQMGAIPYYAEDEKKRSASEIEKIYGLLEKTNFPTLYAVINPGDDFAESLTNYAHTVLLQKPFEIKIFEEDAEVKTYLHCWQEQRCLKKRELLEKFLAQPATD